LVILVLFYLSQNKVVLIHLYIFYCNALLQSFYTGSTASICLYRCVNNIRRL